jgi:hypothetical protein
VFLGQVNKKKVQTTLRSFKQGLFYTEQVGVAITPYACSLEDVWFESWTPGILTEGFRGFTYSLQEDSTIISGLGHDRFLLNHFQFFIQESSCYTGSMTK